MTKKLMLGIFFVSLLLPMSLALEAEGSSLVPAMANVDAVPSDCDCLNEDSAPFSPGLSANVIIEQPNQVPQQHPGGCVYRCVWMFFPDQGIWGYYCRWVCGFAK